MDETSTDKALALWISVRMILNSTSILRGSSPSSRQYHHVRLVEGQCLVGSMEISDHSDDHACQDLRADDRCWFPTAW